MKTNTVPRSKSKYFIIFLIFLIFSSACAADAKETKTNLKHSKNKTDLKAASHSGSKKSKEIQAHSKNKSTPSHSNLQKNKPTSKSIAHSSATKAKSNQNHVKNKPALKKSSNKIAGKSKGNLRDQKNKLLSKKGTHTASKKVLMSHNHKARIMNSRIIAHHTAKVIQSNSFRYKSSDVMEKTLRQEMKGYLGIPYRSGGTSMAGFDCSGFSRMIYSNLFGIKLPHSSAEQFMFPKLQTIDDDDELQTGDLIFFSRRKHINHVGVYLGDGNFIHATNGNGIMISSLDDQHWKSMMVGSKRPMSFDNSDMDTFPSPGGFSLSADASGRVNTYARDNFRPFAGLSGGNQSPAANIADTTAFNFDTGHLYSYEIEYSQKLWDKAVNVNFSAINEKFDKTDAWNVYDHEIDTDWFFKLSNDNSFYDNPFPTVRNGFKLASEISPFEGFSITPSFVYLDYPQQPMKEMMEVPKRVFGLDSQLISITSPWSLSMAVHYADQQSLTSSSFLPSDFLSSTDMSFKLGYYFSRNLEFSIMGRHDFKTVPSLTDITTTIDPSTNNDFLLKFDMAY